MPSNDNFSWRDYYQALYDSIHEQNLRIAGIKNDVEDIMKDYLKRATWINGVLFSVFIAVMVYMLNVTNVNTRDIEALKGKVDSQSQTIILQDHVYQRDYDQLQKEIQWLKDNTELRKRGVLQTINKKGNGN